MRLDQFLVQKGLAKSRERAKQLIEEKGCLINGKLIKKASFAVGEADIVILQGEDFDYVSRAGLKLEAALGEFRMEVKDLVAVDIGVATGGFSQCLLKFGARKVYGVDIGEGQIAEKILKESNFVFRNQTDGKKLQASDFAEKIDLIVIDVSFVSILGFFQTFKNLMDSKTVLVALIKPQFEKGERHSGVIKSEYELKNILTKIDQEFREQGFMILKKMPSPITGKEGNQEFLWKIIRKTE
ncbi:MAG: TlyA family RNA methyltransferase [Candidatus Altimarinota bacterium]